MPYTPSRGGHAPGHLRDAFLKYLDEGGEDYASVENRYVKQEKPISRLIGQLWNCTDILPSMYCSEQDIRNGSTYAQAVRKLATEV